MMLALRGGSFALAALAMLLPLEADAGALYGTVRLSSAPLVGARILLACPAFDKAQSSTSAQSDGSGSFALNVGATGRCQMRVEHGGRAGPNFDVYVSDNPVRFDLAVDQGLARTK
jgi:hypothetical protein